jgi:hypothetical protein
MRHIDLTKGRPAMETLHVVDARWGRVRNIFTVSDRGVLGPMRLVFGRKSNHWNQVNGVARRQATRGTI